VLFIAAVTVLLMPVTDLKSIVALANVGALAAMIVVSAAAFRLARQGWPGEGVRLPGGVLIPVVGIGTTLMQFPSLSWGPVGVGLALFVVGLVLYGVRHQRRFGHGVAEHVRHLVATRACFAPPPVAALPAVPAH
jgi:amino acid transporter